MKKIEEALNSFGFRCEVTTEGGVTTFFFRRKKEKRDEIIYVTGRKATKKGPLGYEYTLNLLWPCVSFPEVETIISDSKGLAGTHFHTIVRSVGKEVAESAIKGLRVDNYYRVNISTEEGIGSYAELLQEIYQKYASPFYEQFDNLQKVDDYLTATSNDKDRRLISNYGGNTAVFRMIIIKYLCNNPGAQDYHKSVINDIQANIANKTIAEMGELLLKIEEKLRAKGLNIYTRQ